MTDQPQTVEERVARHLAARNYLMPGNTADDAWWNSRDAELRKDYLAYAREVIALVPPAAVPVVSPPVTDRAGLRDRIAAAMREHYLCTDRNEADADGNMPCRCGDWREPGPMGSDEDDWDTHLADAVLAVLPPSVDRGAVLRSAADELWALANRLTERGAGVLWAADRLRRMADEEQQPAEVPCCSDPTCTCNQVNAEGRCDCARWEPAVEAQQQPEIVIEFATEARV